MDHSTLGNDEAEDRSKIKSEKLKLEPDRKLLCGSDSLTTDISRMWSVFFQSVSNVSLNDKIKLHEIVWLYVKMPVGYLRVNVTDWLRGVDDTRHRLN